MEEKMYCPECGHEFVQGESNYNYETANTDYVCPECGWEGTNNEVIDGDEMEVDEIGELN